MNDLFMRTKGFLLTMLFAVQCAAGFAQLNVQLHHDLGDALYGRPLSDRPHWTATIENFTADRWGSTYFFVDANFGAHVMESAYAELSRELRWWKAPVAVHVEYNGGLSNRGSYSDAYLLGAAYNWANADFSRTFSAQALYRYQARYRHGSRHSWQLTAVWGIHFAQRVCSFTGYVDLAHDNSVDGNLVMTSEPQFWVNVYALKGVSDKVRLSVGTEVEISNNFVWPTDGRNNRFYVIPTLAAKWTF